MSTVAVVVIVILAILIIGFAGFYAWRRQQRRRLRERFGPEYDRAVERHRSTREAEQELRAREQRHHELPIRPLSAEVRDRYRAEWQRVQERFVDAPEAAVAEADTLLTRVMTERGYPTDDFEQQAADLSVEHAATVGRYRAAHDIRGRADAGSASTEDLRQAMVHYRALVAELLGGDLHHGVSRADAGTPGEAPAESRTETVAAGTGATGSARTERPGDGGTATAANEAGTPGADGSGTGRPTADGSRTGRSTDGSGAGRSRGGSAAAERTHTDHTDTGRAETETDAAEPVRDARMSEGRRR